MAFDFYAACNALAARFAAGTLTAPTGEAAMRGSYGQDPNDIPFVPAVVVFPSDGELIYGAGQKNGEYRVDVKFFLSKASGDFKRIETSRQKWLPVLLGALDGQMALGMGSANAGPVQKAIPLTWEFGQFIYGSDTYDGIVLHTTIYTLEPLTLVA